MSILSHHLPPTLADTSPVANGVALTREPLVFFERLAREAGNFAHYALNDRVVYFVNEPKLIREVLVVREDSFRKWAFNDSFRLIFGDGLIGSSGELHRKVRKAAQPPLQQSRLSGYAETIVDLAERRQNAWREGEIDLSGEMTLLTVEVIARVLFSTSLGDRAGKILEATHTLLGLSTKLGGSVEDVRAFAEANATVSAIAEQLLEEGASAGSQENVLSHLLAAHARDENAISKKQLRQEMRTFILAGHVTTAQSLACACWLLARDPVSEKKLHEEVDTILAGRRSPVEDLPKLSFCEMVMLETLRLYPPVWVFGREAVRDVNLDGFTLPAGSELVICPWLLHRNPRIFPEPDKFDPERWRNAARARLPRCSYLPFSTGLRNCLGEHFAMMESILVLASITEKWKFRELPARHDPGWTPQLLYWPRRGIRLQAERRPALKTK